MTAANIIRAQIYANGTHREVNVYNPSTNLIGIDRNVDELKIRFLVAGMDVVEIEFASQALMTTFISTVESAMFSGTGVVEVSNQGPVATTTSTTTTTAAP